MQQMQLWIFWSIVAAFIVCGCISRGNRQKSYQRKLCGQRARTNISPAVSVSKKKGAVIGRAAGEPYRPSKKLNQVCDPKGLFSRAQMRPGASSVCSRTKYTEPFHALLEI